MEDFCYEENKRIIKDMFDSDLLEFKESSNKDELIEKYKSQMRFLTIISRDIALEKNQKDYAKFLDGIINEETYEILSLNKAYKNGTFYNELQKYNFHDKINIIFYVRKDFYNSKYDSYAVLDEDVKAKLSRIIIEEANIILKEFNVSISEIKLMNINNINKLINDNKLALDIMFASELIK